MDGMGPDTLDIFILRGEFVPTLRANPFPWTIGGGHPALAVKAVEQVLDG